MASEIGIAFMFFIQTGLALVTVLGAFFCIVYHFFSHSTSEPHPSKFQNNDWAPHCMIQPPAREDHRKPQLNKTRGDLCRVRHGGVSGEKKRTSSPDLLPNCGESYGCAKGSRRGGIRRQSDSGRPADRHVGAPTYMRNPSRAAPQDPQAAWELQSALQRAETNGELSDWRRSAAAAAEETQAIQKTNAPSHRRQADSYSNAASFHGREPHELQQCMHFDMQQLPHAAGASTWQPPAGTATATAAAAATQYPIAPVLPHFGLRHEAAADPQPQQQHSAAAQQVTSSYAATEAYLAGAPEYSNDYEAACASMMWQATRHGPELPAAAVYAAGPGWHLTDPQQQQQHHHGSNGLLQGSSTRGVALPLLRTSLRSSDPTLQTGNARASSCSNSTACAAQSCCQKTRCCSGELGNSLGAAAAGRDSQTKEIAQLVRVADAIESLLGASAKRRTTEPFSSSSSSSSSSTGDACSAGCPAATAAGAAADSNVGEGGAGSSNAAQQGAPKEQALLCSKAEAKPLSKSETATEKYPPAKRNWHAAEEGSQEAEEGDMKRRSAVAAAAAAAFPMEAAKKTRTNLMTNILLLVCSHQNKSYRAGRLRLQDWCRRHAGSLSPDQCASATANHLSARQGGSRADFEATLEATKQIRSVFCPHVVNFFEVHLVGDLVCESDLALFPIAAWLAAFFAAADEEPSEARLTKVAANLKIEGQLLLKVAVCFSSATSAPGFTDLEFNRVFAQLSNAVIRRSTRLRVTKSENETEKEQGKERLEGREYGSSWQPLLNELRETSDLQKNQLDSRTLTKRKSSRADAAPADSTAAADSTFRPPAREETALPLISANTNTNEEAMCSTTRTNTSLKPLRHITNDEPPPVSETASTAASVDNNQGQENTLEPSLCCPSAPLRIKPEDSTNTRAGQVQQQQQQREGGEGQKRKRKSNESTGNTGFSLHLSLQKGGPRAAPFASAALRPSSSAAPAAANRSSSSSSKGCQQQQCTPLQQRIKAKRPSDKTEIHAFPGTPEMPSDSSSLTTYVQYTHRGDAVSSSASPGSPNSENVGGPQRSKRKPAPAAPPNRGGPEDTKKLKARNKGLLKKEL